MDRQRKIELVGRPLYYGVRITMLLMGMFVLMMVLFTLEKAGLISSFSTMSTIEKAQIIGYPVGAIAFAILIYSVVTRYFQQRKLDQQFAQASSFIEEFLIDEIEVEDEFEAADRNKKVDADGIIQRINDIPAKKIEPLNFKKLTKALKTEALTDQDLDTDLASPWLEYIFKHFIHNENLIDSEDKVFIAYQAQEFLGYQKKEREVFYYPTEVIAGFLEAEVMRSNVDLPPRKNNTEKRRVNYRQALPILARAMHLPWNAGDILTRIEKLLSPKSRFSKAYGDFLLFRAEDFKFWDQMYRCQSKEVRGIAYEILRTIKEFYDIIGSEDDVLSQANKVSIYTEFAAKFTKVRILARELSQYFESNDFEQSIEQAKGKFQQRELLVELASIYQGMTNAAKKALPENKLKVYEKAEDNLKKLDEFLAMELAFSQVSSKLKELKELISVDEIHALSSMISNLRELVAKAKKLLNSKSEIDQITGENLDKLLEAAIKKIVSDSNLRIYSLTDKSTINELVGVYQKVYNVMGEELDKLNLKVFDELSSIDDLVINS